jgi:hypothetical protein
VHQSCQPEALLLLDARSGQWRQIGQSHRP